MSTIALIISDNPTTRIPVQVNAPTAAGFQWVTITLDLELITSQEFNEIYTAEVLADPAGGIVENPDTRLFKRCVKGWAGLGSSSDQELAFSEQAVAQVCKLPWLLGPCAVAISEALQGRAEAIEKN